MRKPIEEQMATITEYLNPLSSRNMIMNSMFYQCRRPAPLGVPWDTGKRAKKRHSTPFSPFDKSVLKGDVVETSSLPSTPIPFVSSEGRKISFDDLEFFKDDTSSILSSSESSGYLSASSSESSSLGSSPFSCSPSPSYFQLRKLSSKSENIHKSSTTPTPSSTKVFSKRKDSIATREITSTKKINTETLNVASDASGITTSSPITETSLSQSATNNDTRDSSPSSKLISVSVPSKRCCFESSSSNGSMCTDDAIRHRVKDDEGFIRRAACLCVNEDESKVVLISSKNEGGGWLVPGGGLESGEGEAEAAEREAWEEAGITGKVQRCLGIFQSEDEVTHKKKRTAVYVLKVKEQHSVFPEATLGRVREWFSIDTAVHHLSQCKPHQIAYLRAL